MTHEFLDTKEASVYLNNKYNMPITSGSMEVWRHLKRGPRYLKIARWVRYKKDDLDEFARGKTIETVDSKTKEG